MFRHLFQSPFARASLILAGYLALVATLLVLPTQTAAPAPEKQVRVLAGSRVWREGNCVSCHAIYGLGGHLGPDLTGIIRTKGAPYAKVMIQTGRPGMPACTFDADKIDDLLAYLDFIGTTGTYPLRKRPLPIFGAIE